MSLVLVEACRFLLRPRLPDIFTKLIDTCDARFNKSVKLFVTLEYCCEINKSFFPKWRCLSGQFEDAADKRGILHR